MIVLSDECTTFLLFDYVLFAEWGPMFACRLRLDIPFEEGKAHPHDSQLTIREI